ncbi:MAG: hypothetical protein ACK56I_30790, partial [bacterium]
ERHREAAAHHLVAEIEQRITAGREGAAKAVTARLLHLRPDPDREARPGGGAAGGCHRAGRGDADAPHAGVEGAGGGVGVGRHAAVCLRIGHHRRGVEGVEP